MKYFVISDIHSFYKEMIEALNEAGYDKNNQDHTLIVCGDIFDRGSETKQVLKFLQSIPKERRILIRGNHEYLIQDAFQEVKDADYYTTMFSSHHYTNGTVSTMCHLNDIDDGGDYGYVIPTDIQEKEKKAHNIQKFIKWVNSDEWVNYFELGRFIFVHCWIPVISSDGLPMYYTRSRQFEYNPDWKNASARDWEEATWGCPWVFEKQGLTPNGKTIVCGHWHASDFHKIYEDQEDNFELFYSKNLIAIDACTAYSRFCNVLVIDENGICYDKHGTKMESKEN